MEINERDLLLTLADTVRKLANAVALSHAQLEALRTVVIGVHGALYGMPELQGRIEQSLGGSIEGDFAQALGTPQHDDALRQRQEWLSALIPADVWEKVRPRSHV
ncbi:hypothetical protein WHX56_17225 [Achromobacter veterisilvae]|jgi:hypothetical protein|uniref:Uncharacterized protein n=1 Tax=Achromobacter veterisilvae TaxID=2069367 RepID=A0A446CMP2_9BURK|nr:MULTISPECIES: hypothetical protein [Achromobacter]MCW0210616.1 hypothetical protein [Achromobacter sp.]SSW69174.1 hypothetical protein AVE30378_03362 [Achromobacter veterisilvae]